MPGGAWVTRLCGMDLTAQIEAAAQTADPNERRAKLRVLREEAEAQLGTIDTYLTTADYEREAAVNVFAQKEAAARANATIREELVRRGLVDDADMDDAGMLSHDDLDALAEEGLLEAALDVMFPIEEGPGRVFGTMIHFQERLHPRDRGGKFAKKPGAPPTPKTRKGAAPKPPTKPGGAGKEVERAAGAARAGEEARRAAQFQPVKPEDVPVRPKGQSDVNKERVARLAQRIGTRLSRAQAGRGGGSPENTIFNAKGSVSQHTLLQYVREAASEPDTMQLHSRMGQDGKPVWTPERRELHEKVIDMFLRERRPVPRKDGSGKTDWALCEDCPPLEPDPDGHPKVLFSGGGYAAGKGASLARMGDAGKPKGAFVLDPDEIKSYLPEFMDGLAKDDPEANLHTYREAWEIAQEVQRRAQQKKLNMVVDGISDTTVDEIDQRVQSFLDHGYGVQMVYTDIPTEEAIKRAAGRAAGAEKDSDRRHIPDVIMRAVHRDVAATIPALLEHMASKPTGTARPQISVFDNNQGKAADGSFNPPKLMASFDNTTGEFNVHDDSLWRALQAKGNEQIPGVDAPQRVTEAAEGPQEGKPTMKTKDDAQQPAEPQQPAQQPAAPAPADDGMPKTTDDIVAAGLRVDVPYETPNTGTGLKYADAPFGAGSPPVPDDLADRGAQAVVDSGLADDPDSAREWLYGGQDANAQGDSAGGTASGNAGETTAVRTASTGTTGTAAQPPKPAPKPPEAKP